ncbi:hypothetical protein sos41_42530 [Alphaproteobacteria bacterium SO-S41]|nr:hypothetical protein sos41_42530 [Alphaproteobacteria bacterium SO-S41]
MSAGPSGLYTIAPGRAFLTDLARGIVDRFDAKANPLSLAGVTVFLPTRRAARTLAEELTKASGRAALVLPRIVTLGEVDEDEEIIVREGDLDDVPAEIPRLERDLLLARLVDHLRQTDESAGGFAVSLALARALARLIDDAANEDVMLEGLAALAPPDLASHWQRTVAFLEIATAAWPDILAARGRMDPAARRNTLLRSYALRLERERPTAPFIAAGSSGSVKATAALLKVIAGLPNGAVVLNGLDTHLDQASWDVLPPSHPQFALKELLDHLGVTRSAAGGWIAGAEATAFSPRAVFLSEAMRPPETADAWADPARPGAALLSGGVEGLTLLEAANEREEALAIALAIRETLEQPEASVALVTHDRMLARRVAADLRRWEIEADDSAGLPLAKTEAGSLLTLALEAAIAGGTPVALLSLLKHPRVTLGWDRARVLRTARRLEERVLRRERVTGGFDAARTALGDRTVEPERWDLLDAVETALAPLTALARTTPNLSRLVAAHAAVAEALTRDAQGKAGAWSGGDGEAAFALTQDLLDAARHEDQTLPLADYAIVFDGAARGAPVRPQGPRHPRVAIWGPLEARLHSADLMILGGLNEGVWPANPADDPWLSRPMRAGLGLSAPERRIGLAAHDFATLAAQPNVLLTRARRREGAPASPSRFLLRLGALADGIRTPLPRADMVDLARRLDAAETVIPATRPAPTPPVTARPRELSVTRIEGLLRDPYAIYAEYVLGLRPLDALERELEARDRGTIIHKAAENFARLTDDQRSGDPYADLLSCGRAAFGDTLNEPDVAAFWWPRFERAARFLAARETEWQADRADSVMEEKGTLKLPGLDFTLKGTPDRIDRMHSGGIRVIDYKTGAAPSIKQVETFLAPQLPLLALMAKGGAFGPGMKGDAEALIYAQIGGGRTPGKVTELGDAGAVVAEIEQRLLKLIAKYDDPATPYPSRAGMESTRYEGDYDHLARLGEWGELQEGEG